MRNADEWRRHQSLSLLFCCCPLSLFRISFTLLQLVIVHVLIKPIKLLWGDSKVFLALALSLCSCTSHFFRFLYKCVFLQSSSVTVAHQKSCWKRMQIEMPSYFDRGQDDEGSADPRRAFRPLPAMDVVRRALKIDCKWQMDEKNAQKYEVLHWTAVVDRR